MSRKRKQHVIILTVSAPPELTAAEVRREVRSLINDQCNYSADEGDLKVRRVLSGSRKWLAEGASS